MPVTLPASPSQPNAEALVADVARQHGLDRGHALDYRALVCELFELALDARERDAGAKPTPIARASIWYAAQSYCASRSAE